MSHRRPIRHSAQYRSAPGRAAQLPHPPRGGNATTSAPRSQALARAMPAPSLWIADLLILGLALTILRALW